jgi:hypothetical protein
MILMLLNLYNSGNDVAHWPHYTLAMYQYDQALEMVNHHRVHDATPWTGGLGQDSFEGYNFELLALCTPRMNRLVVDIY